MMKLAEQVEQLRQALKYSGHKLPARQREKWTAMIRAADQAQKREAEATPEPAETPDLRAYDIVEISSSGGKDSHAMVHHVAGLLRGLGILDRGVVVHADLGRMEWPGSLETARAHAEAAGLRFRSLKRPQGDLLDQARALRHWPTPSTRWCTANHKRGQILVVLGELAAEERTRRGLSKTAPIRILNCVGLRAEESPGRAKRPALQIGARGSSPRRLIDMWLPIKAWSTEQVWEAVHASGWPVHPAYEKGLPRASCIFCIYAPRAALQIGAREHPKLLAEYVKVEREIGHEFKHHLPIADIARDIERGVVPAEKIESWRM